MTTRIAIASIATGATNSEGANITLSALCSIGHELRNAAHDADCLGLVVGQDVRDRVEIAIIRSHEVALAANRLTRALRRELSALEERETVARAFEHAAQQTADTAEVMR